MSGRHSWGRAPKSPPRPQVRGAPTPPARARKSDQQAEPWGPGSDRQSRNTRALFPMVLSHPVLGPAPTSTLPGSAPAPTPRPGPRLLAARPPAGPYEAALASPPHVSAGRAGTTLPGARVPPAAPRSAAGPVPFTPRPPEPREGGGSKAEGVEKWVRRGPPGRKRRGRGRAEEEAGRERARPGP